ncbi:Anticodon binding domain [Popillia japonica]|uniref:Anticodon binding domain n=1 Tax=Popillia japonica TaxID=7064 RepID=A0AAW1KK33_POPJA
MNRVSKLFQPINKIPKSATIKHKEITSKSQRLMLDLGIIKLASPGTFHLLPLGVRALEKLKSFIDKEMHKINAQKLALPALTQAELWEKSGRLNNSAELFTVTDRHKNLYILSPVDT